MIDKYKNWTGQYAKKTGIWQGRSWWHGLRDLVLKFKK